MFDVSGIVSNLVTFSVLIGTMAQCAKQIEDNNKEYEEYDEDEEEEEQ